MRFSKRLVECHTVSINLGKIGFRDRGKKGRRAFAIWVQPPKCRLGKSTKIEGFTSPKVEIHRDAARLPVPQERAILHARRNDQWLLVHGNSEGGEELRPVPLTSLSIDDPNQLGIKLLARQPLCFWQEGVLKFKGNAIIGLDIGNVFFLIRRRVDALLPFLREVIFPVAMPLRFRLPPCVAGSRAFVCPMPNAMLTALRDRGIATDAALTGQARFSFAGRPFNESVSHGPSSGLVAPRWASARMFEFWRISAVSLGEGDAETMLQGQFFHHRGE